MTFLRVHGIGGVMDFYDYSPAAVDMTYQNQANPGGVMIDGRPDPVTPGTFTWELVTGQQGSVTHVGALRASFALPGLTSYYLDDLTPPVTQCPGDPWAYGSSGLWVAQAIPNTDPRNPRRRNPSRERARFTTTPRG